MDDGCEPALVGGREMVGPDHALRAGFSERLHPRRKWEKGVVVSGKKLAWETAPRPMPLRRRKSRRERSATWISDKVGFMGGGCHHSGTCRPSAWASCFWLRSKVRNSVALSFSALAT